MGNWKLVQNAVHLNPVDRSDTIGDDQAALALLDNDDDSCRGILVE